MHTEREESAPVAGTNDTGTCGRTGRGGAAFWLGQGLVGATGGTEMIGARVRVVSGDGNFTIVVCAESLREIEQTAKMRYPGSSVRITFPLKPEWFFAGGPHTGAHTRLEAMERLINPTRPS